MRTAVVGLGEIGQHHLRAARACEDVELVAVCDLDHELAARSADGAAAYSDLSQMLDAEHLEALCICLPHVAHLDAALAGIEAGCNILLEKPMAVDVASCERIAAAASATGLGVAVSHNQLHYEPHRRVIELVAKGRLGRLRSIYARLSIGERYRGWREDPAAVGGGLLMDAGVHRIYLLRALGGPISAVTAVMDEPRAEESFTVALELGGGAIAVAQGSYFAPAGVFDDRLDVIGSEGIATVAGCEAYFEGDLRGTPQLRTRLEGVWREEAVEDSWEASVRRSVTEALAALASGREPPVDAAAATETVAIIEAAYRSAEGGGRVQLGAVAEGAEAA